MKLLLSRVVVIFVGVLCVVTALSLLIASDTYKVHAATTEIDAIRPTLNVTTLSGEAFDLQAQRGKWVVVNYWATWCAPCIKEMPALSAFVSSRADVTAIGLAYESRPADKIRAFVRKHPVNYPVALVDPAHPPSGIAMPSVLPTTFLIGPDGHLVRKLVGPLDMHELASIIGKQVKP